MIRVMALIAPLLVGCAVQPSKHLHPEVDIVQPVVDTTTQVELTNKGMRKLAAAVAAEVDKKFENRNNGILTSQAPPPNADSYPQLRNDNVVFYEYVDDFNWYLNYIFSYTTVLNDYAVARGWQKPDSIPICKLIVHGEMQDLPKFEPNVDPNKDLRAFEWALVDYIKTIKEKYRNEIVGEDALRDAQRLLCVF